MTNRATTRAGARGAGGTATGPVTLPPGRDLVLPEAAVAMTWQGPGRPLQAVAVPGVRLQRGDALVRVDLATICDSDVHTVAGRRPGATPCVLGHEQVGRVVDADAHARSVDGRRLLPGMRVVWSVVVACGRCVECHRGLPQACASLERHGHAAVRRSWELGGGFASHVHVRRGAAVVVVDDDAVPDEVLAPASCAVATAAEAVHRASSLLALAAGGAVAEALRGQVVVVSGAGARGLAATAMATQAGARVVVVEASECRRLLACRFGAAAVADPGESRGPLSLARALAQVDRSGRHRTVALETSGSSAAVALLVDTVGVGGVVVLAGPVAPGAAVPVLPERVERGLLTLTGVHDYAPASLVAAVAFVSEQRHRYPFAELVEHVVPLEQLDDALRLASAPGAPVRVGVRPGRAGGR
ncbi:alcohol dehydrogenase catalytic domain-containing protein [Frigoribacterium endophyticum]|uniref:alcohol dehydrogenase catalytic domain-containing protein n=1 Tax=Frigoribacterium endophyticum TaxID=1522176 RepID=UPI001FBB19DE|nr:alcohol dehydrogenase catalytic domain-containing protein [Frigoribacterium endophyticum]NII51141.1 putative phosphonate catabolism associated alcohol dehydrogenase [Frigoribacterium endophyticum]